MTAGPTPDSDPHYFLYYAIEMYFKNGGGPCYVSSAGNYDGGVAKDALAGAIDLLEKEDEPTLLVLTDWLGLKTQDHLDLSQQALIQCGKLKDRFAILDVPQTVHKSDSQTDGPTDPVDAFRQVIGTDLMYGAAYMPFLNTSLAAAYDERQVEVRSVSADAEQPYWERSFGTNAFTVAYAGEQTDPSVALVPEGADVVFSDANGVLTISGVQDITGAALQEAWENGSNSITGEWDVAANKRGNAAAKIGRGGVAAGKATKLDLVRTWEHSFGHDTLTVTYVGTVSDPVMELSAGGEISFEAQAKTLKIGVKPGQTAADYMAKWDALSSDATNGWSMAANGSGDAVLVLRAGTVRMTTPSRAAQVMASLAQTNTALYNRLKAALADQRIVLPPSSAIAGIYARVDRERGVWKAPANVAVTSVIGPVQKINDEEQGRLNVDPNTGKSINAIRAFPGKGTLVWGARTLAGNDNEWRYVSVRRLFITIEESTKRPALSPFSSLTTPLRG